jgi:Phosphoenolpyruvate carboxykinase
VLLCAFHHSPGKTFFLSKHALWPLTWHIMQPGRYAETLANRVSKHRVDCWLINTAWTSGRYGTGKHCPAVVTRRVVDVVNSGEPTNVQYETFETFGLHISHCVEVSHTSFSTLPSPGRSAPHSSTRFVSLLGRSEGYLSCTRTTRRRRKRGLLDHSSRVSFLRLIILTCFLGIPPIRHHFGRILLPRFAFVVICRVVG